MKNEIPPPIAHPCPMSWSGMAGDAKRRFCDHCHRHVHNLSEMNADERRDVLASGERHCITYTLDSSGTLLTHARPHWTLSLFSRFRVGFVALAAALVPFALSSCVTRKMGSPMPPANNPAKQADSDDDQTVALLGEAPSKSRP